MLGYFLVFFRNPCARSLSLLVVAVSILTLDHPNHKTRVRELREKVVLMEDGDVWWEIGDGRVG